MFKKFFKKEDEEELYEKVDPVLEQRRKEKFSTPLIYNDEVEENEPKQDIKKEDVKKKEIKKNVNIETNYRMSEIISPMMGLKETKKTDTPNNRNIQVYFTSLFKEPFFVVILT